MALRTPLQQFLHDAVGEAQTLGITPPYDNPFKSEMIEKYGRELDMATKVILLHGSQALLQRLLESEGGEYSTQTSEISAMSPYIIWP